MNLFLISHITGAIITGTVVAFSVVALCKSWDRFYKPLIKFLLACAVFQILTGAGLAVFAQSSFVGICTKVGIYLVVIGATYFALHIKVSNLSLSPDLRNK